MNDLILRSIRRERIERYPIWLMRQAGRYMEDYRRIRENFKNFLELCKDVRASVEITLLPLKLLKVDALIVFSDILCILEGMGAKLSYGEGEGPKLEWEGDLKEANPRDMEYLYEIINEVCKAQREVPVIGFCGGPFTLLSYLIEGGSPNSLKKTKKFMKEKPEKYQKIMQILTKSLINYLKNQVKAGAKIVQVFDTWAGLLSYYDYRDLVLPYVGRIAQEVKGAYTIYFLRGGSNYLDLLNRTQYDVLSFDWTTDITSLKTKKCIQGNLDPDYLYLEGETLKGEVLKFLSSLPFKTGYIFNLGHGVGKGVPFENVKLLVDTVRSYALH